jgi:hypothetical protein
MGTSANVPDVQPPQPTSADAPQPTVAEAQAKRKALTDAEAQQKRQKFMSIPTSAPSSASLPVDATEQTVNPPIQDIPSAIIPQGPTTDEATEDIPSASSADPPHGILQAALSSQIQEIAFKQVSRLT